MIVQSMSYEDICKEFDRDYRSVYEKAQFGFGNMAKYHKYCMTRLKADEFHLFRPIQFESSRKNTYVVLYSVNGKTGYKKQGLIISLFMLYRSRNGTNAIIKSDDGVGYAIFITHFFERYRERQLKNEQLSLFDAICDFFGHLKYVHYFRTNNEKYKDSIFLDMGSGICLCEEYSKQLIINKTFISYEMLKGNQIEDKDLLLALNENLNSIKFPDSERLFYKGLKDRKVDYYGEPIVLEGLNNDYQISLSDFHDCTDSLRAQLERYSVDIFTFSQGDIDSSFGYRNIYNQYVDKINVIEHPIRPFVFAPQLIKGKSGLNYIYQKRYDGGGNTVDVFNFILINIFKYRGLYYAIHGQIGSGKYNFYSENLFNSYKSRNKYLANKTKIEVICNFFNRLEMLTPIDYIPSFNPFYLDIGEECPDGGINEYVVDAGFCRLKAIDFGDDFIFVDLL